MDLCCQNNGMLNKILFRDEREKWVNSNSVVFFFFLLFVCIPTLTLKKIHTMLASHLCTAAEEFLESFYQFHVHISYWTLFKHCWSVLVFNGECWSVFNGE